MAFAYNPTAPSGRLSEGELLLGVAEPRLEPVTNSGTFTKVLHSKSLILTPDCDLLSDFLYRYPDDERRNKSEAVRSFNLLDHMLFCDIYEKEEARPAVVGADIWRRIEANQDARYQHIPSGTRANPGSGDHPELYVDFKRVFSLPLEWIYELIRLGEISRQGVIPSPWLASVVTRLFSFQSRICLPDPTDERKIMDQIDLLPTASN